MGPGDRVTTAHSHQSHQGGARTLAFRPDGTTLATVGDDGQMWVWSPLTGTPAHPFTDDSIRGVTAAAFHPAGTILAAAVDRGI
ncbi:WD40 repeat domain-containing protein [Streptomyces sp. NPDC001177]